MKNFKEILESEKWYPIIHVTNTEYRLSEAQNDLLDALKLIDDKDMPFALDFLKTLLINIALKADIKL